MFVNTWTADGKFLFNIVGICNSQFKCNYLKNEKLYLDFLSYFWNLHQILRILQKKMMVIASVFPRLQSVNNFVTNVTKNCRFGTPLNSRHVKGSRTLTKSPCWYFYHVFSSILGKLIMKIFPPKLGEIYGDFVNTLTADGKFLFNIVGICNSQFKCDYLKNEKFFLNFLSYFWNLYQILHILKKGWCS